MCNLNRIIKPRSVFYLFTEHILSTEEMLWSIFLPQILSFTMWKLFVIVKWFICPSLIPKLKLTCELTISSPLTCAFSVYHPLWDSFPVKVGHLIRKDHILDKQRASWSCSLDVQLVSNRMATSCSQYIRSLIKTFFF